MIDANFGVFLFYNKINKYSFDINYDSILIAMQNMRINISKYNLYSAQYGLIYLEILLVNENNSLNLPMNTNEYDSQHESILSNIYIN